MNFGERQSDRLGISQKEVELNLLVSRLQNEIMKLQNEVRRLTIELSGCVESLR